MAVQASSARVIESKGRSPFALSLIKFPLRASAMYPRAESGINDQSTIPGFVPVHAWAADSSPRDLTAAIATVSRSHVPCGLKNNPEADIRLPLGEFTTLSTNTALSSAGTSKKDGEDGR